MYYFSYHDVKTPVLDIRPINKDNFNPMIHPLLSWKDYYELCIQIQITWLGQPQWITVLKSEVKGYKDETLHIQDARS